MTEYGRGTFTGVHELLDLLRRRQAEIGLSNEGLEDICEFAAGMVDKYLGPSRSKWPGLDAVFRMMYALGLSGSLHVDLRKVEKVTPLWRKAGKRKLAAIRTETARVSKAAVKRARSVVLSELGRRGNEIRWKAASPDERKLFGRWLTSQRKRPWQK